VHDFVDGASSAAYAILMLGFVGEPLELQLHPDYWAPLGAWQKVNLAVCSLIYILYTFLSLILLLNLLIALLASNSSKTQAQATLQGRLSFARIVLRLELVATCFRIDTRAGELDDHAKHRYVHNFRSVTKGGEVPRGYQDESVYDEMPPEDEPEKTNDVAAMARSAAPLHGAQSLDAIKVELLQELKAGLKQQLKTLLKPLGASQQLPLPATGLKA